MPAPTVVGTGVPVLTTGVPLVIGVTCGEAVNKGSTVADGSAVGAVGVLAGVGEPGTRVAVFVLTRVAVGVGVIVSVSGV
jgi:hypothetical protein